MPDRHVYVGLSTAKVWCGAKPAHRHPNPNAFSPAPLTEGEYIDGFGSENDICRECAAAVEAVRGPRNKIESESR